MTHRFSKQAVQVLQPLAAAATLALAPVVAQAQTAPTQLWVDLSTSTMTGMPEMLQGGVGGMIGGLFGGGRGGGGSQTYGHASGRFIQQGSGPSLTGAFPPNRVIDLALYNPRKPGTEAALAIPPTMGMGEQLPLVPPSPGFKEPGDSAPGEVPEVKGRLLVYWGCGDKVRPGQPKVINLASNPAQWAPVLAGRHAPERAAKVGAQHALYPNEKNTVNPKADTSLVGEHQVRGEGVPESMRFQLAERQDLMSAIRLQSQGQLTESIQLSWLTVPRAHAYHLHAMGMAGDDMVLWSSADNGDAGLGLFDYLTDKVCHAYSLGTERICDGMEMVRIAGGLLILALGLLAHLVRLLLQQQLDRLEAALRDDHARQPRGDRGQGDSGFAGNSEHGTLLLPQSRGWRAEFQAVATPQAAQGSHNRQSGPSRTRPACR